MITKKLFIDIFPNLKPMEITKKGDTKFSKK